MQILIFLTHISFILLAINQQIDNPFRDYFILSSFFLIIACIGNEYIFFILLLIYQIYCLFKKNCFSQTKNSENELKNKKLKEDTCNPNKSSLQEFKKSKAKIQNFVQSNDKKSQNHRIICPLEKPRKTIPVFLFKKNKSNINPEEFSNPYAAKAPDSMGNKFILDNFNSIEEEPKNPSNQKKIKETGLQKYYNYLKNRPRPNVLKNTFNYEGFLKKDEESPNNFNE